jgi:hypothetical protein
MNMNDRDEIEPDDDRKIFNALSKLRGIDPPAGSRIRNRAAVDEALRAIDSETPELVRPMPWWQRSVSVPLPLAACLLFVFVLLGAVALRSGNAHDVQVGPAQQIQVFNPHPRPLSRKGRGETELADSPDAEAHPALVYRASATYLCGIGQVHSTHGYFFTEQGQ